MLEKLAKLRSYLNFSNELNEQKSIIKRYNKLKFFQFINFEFELDSDNLGNGTS